MRDIRCIVFDFGDTLSSRPYFRELGTEFLRIVDTKIWGDGAPAWCDPWLRGELTSADIAAHLSELTGVAPANILSALDAGCASLTLNPAICCFAQAQRANGRQTALVTLNMDVFTRVIAPSLGFHQIFDVVINSADYRIGNKVRLWEIAFAQLDGCLFENSLLIDDKLKYIERFRARGGMGYQYRTDEAFAEWVQTLEENGYVLA